MSKPPEAVLSEHFQERLRGRRLVSAVFTTFRLEPAFFETEILPVFVDLPLSHVREIKLIQLEDALRSLAGALAVYYDPHGLVAEGGSAKLDVQRVPVRQTAIFHPKNVLALVEEVEPDDAGHHARALLAGAASANLTRAGWWENVEVAHVEEIAEGEPTSLRDDLLDYLDRLVRAVEGQRPNDELRARHPALREIHRFLREETSQRKHASVDGRLHARFNGGKTRLVDFLEEAAGDALNGLCLEVISPYLDSGDRAGPLEELQERFNPRETLVFLPRSDAGEALCSEALFERVRSLPDTAWGALPDDLLRLGKAEVVRKRTVHAKVYRFFEPKRGGREILYVGSNNLTSPGHQGLPNGNWETGYLVEVKRGGRPEFWLTGSAKRPGTFTPRGESEDTATSGGTLLQLRFHWGTKEGSALWAGKGPSPDLLVQHGGVTVLELSRLPPGEWQSLGPTGSRRLKETLAATSVLEVVGEGPEPGLLLVQEEGMMDRPSLLLDLSAADILRYWSLLSVEQRAAFIEQRARIAGDDDPLVTRLAPLPEMTTLFDRFAGVFHAFHCLEDTVREALEKKRVRDADYRLFGKKYDSLGSLLGRVLEDIDSGKGDRVEQYVVTLCAKQLMKEIGRDYPEYWAEHRAGVEELKAQLARAAGLREALAASSARMPEFLDWFDDLFVSRAKAITPEDAS